MSKRLRAKKCAPGQLRAYWGREKHDPTPDVVLAWGGGGASKSDSHLLHMYLCSKRPTYSLPGRCSELEPSLIDELAARGYDLTTLEFSIKLLPAEKP